MKNNSRFARDVVQKFCQSILLVHPKVKGTLWYKNSPQAYKINFAYWIAAICQQIAAGLPASKCILMIVLFWRF